MSAPFGAPQQGPQAAAPGQPAAPGGPGAPGRQVDGPDLRFLLSLVAAAAGLVGYVLGFFGGPASSLLQSLSGFSFIAAAVLAGIRVLPKVPDMLPLTVVFAAYAALGSLMNMTKGSVDGLLIILLLLAVIQLGAVVGVLLMQAGIIAASGGTSKAAPPSGPLPQAPYAQQPHQPQQPAWNRPQGSGQAGGWGPGVPGNQPQPAPAPPGQQPGAWSPSSGGFAAPGPQSGPSSQSNQPGQQSPIQQGPGQQGPGQQGQDQQAGPKGTQQMPHPGSS